MKKSHEGVENKELLEALEQFVSGQKELLNNFSTSFRTLNKKTNHGVQPQCSSTVKPSYSNPIIPPIHTPVAYTNGYTVNNPTSPPSPPKGTTCSTNKHAQDLYNTYNKELATLMHKSTELTPKVLCRIKELTIAIDALTNSKLAIHTSAPVYPSLDDTTSRPSLLTLEYDQLLIEAYSERNSQFIDVNYSKQLEREITKRAIESYAHSLMGKMFKVHLTINEAKFLYEYVQKIDQTPEIKNIISNLKKYYNCNTISNRAKTVSTLKALDKEVNYSVILRILSEWIDLDIIDKHYKLVISNSVTNLYNRTSNGIATQGNENVCKRIVSDIKDVFVKVCWGNSIYDNNVQRNITSYAELQREIRKIVPDVKVEQGEKSINYYKLLEDFNNEGMFNSIQEVNVDEYTDLEAQLYSNIDWDGKPLKGLDRTCAAIWERIISFTRDELEVYTVPINPLKKDERYKEYSRELRDLKHNKTIKSDFVIQRIAELKDLISKLALVEFEYKSKPKSKVKSVKPSKKVKPKKRKQ